MTSSKEEASLIFSLKTIITLIPIDEFAFNIIDILLNQL